MTDDLVLVTGGSGFLGANVVKLFLDKGYRVRTTVRDSNNQSKVKHLKELCPSAKHKVEIVDADLMDAQSWVKAVNGCVFVHHVASPFPPVLEQPKDENEVIKPAVDGTLNVLKACASAGTVKRVVLTGSMASILNQADENKTYSEEDWLDTTDTTILPYTRSKCLAEKAAWDYVKTLNGKEKFELCVVNPGFIIGPIHSNTKGASIEAFQQMLRRDFPFVLPMYTPICDVRDVALTHYKCMTVPKAAGKRFIVSAESISFETIADVLDKEFRPQGYNVATWVMPHWLLVMMSWFKSELLTVRKFATEPNINNSKITKTLEIIPMSIHKSIIDMGYAVIEKGFVDKTPQYKGPPMAS